MQHGECIECGARIDVPKGTLEGEILVCQECGAELEVVSLHPLQLDLAPTEMEDWGE